MKVFESLVDSRSRGRGSSAAAARRGRGGCCCVDETFEVEQLDVVNVRMRGGRC